MPTTVPNPVLKGSDFVVGICPQVTKSVIPLNPVFTPVRRTSGKGEKTVNYVEDPSVNNDEQGLDQIEDTTDLSAEIAAVVTKQKIEWLIQAIYGTEVPVTVTATTISATLTGLSASSGTPFANFRVGDGVWVGGFTNGDLNGFKIVTAVSATSLSFAGGMPATEAAGASVTVKGNRTLSGKAPTYNVLQTSAPDLSAAGNVNYFTIFDAIIDTYSLEVAETGLANCTASFVAERQLEAYLPIAGQTYAAKPADRAVTSKRGAQSSIKAFYVNDTAATCIVKSLTIEVANNHEKDEASACDAFYVRGQPAFTGSIVLRSFRDNPFVWRNYSYNGTDVKIGVLMQHGGGDETFIQIHRAKVTEATMADGNGQTANTEASWVGQQSNTQVVTISVHRNWS